MASNSSLFVLLLLAAAAVSSSSADTNISSLLGGLSQGATVASLHDTMQCMQKLIPCKSFFNISVTEQPPESCCSPLKEMVSDDFECLCRFYKDPQILKSLNVSRHDALHLPKACHIRLRLSKCSKEASAPTTTPPIPTDPATTQAAAAAVIAAVSTANGSNMPSATSTSSSSSTASTKSISYFGVVVAASASFFFMH
ncbi:hypothetical protein QN277_012269 [Acacia crassicarpa]|nr:hypothetical protein QN277_012269 [Acacia crassicarpa]